MHSKLALLACRLTCKPDTRIRKKEYKLAGKIAYQLSLVGLDYYFMTWNKRVNGAMKSIDRLLYVFQPIHAFPAPQVSG